MGDRPAIIETRGQQLFPVFTESELHRLHRFGTIRQYLAGATVVAAGEPTDSLVFILYGTVAVTVRRASGNPQQIATYGPGAFVGELAQLPGRRSLVAAKALDSLSALVVSTEGLHDLLIGEAEIGERIMRALILRQAGVLEIGSDGPIIIGSRSSWDVLRLEDFLRRNGYSQQTLDPGAAESARSLLEWFKVEDSKLPIVLCPNGRLLRNATESDLTLAIGVDR
jgi:thioredoxin reductase (NADPH)